MLDYTDSAVTRNASEKKINSLLDFISTSTDLDLLQVRLEPPVLLVHVGLLGGGGQELGGLALDPISMLNAQCMLLCRHGQDGSISNALVRANQFHMHKQPSIRAQLVVLRSYTAHEY